MPGTKPVYRRGQEECRRVRKYLNLLDQMHAGCLRDPKARILVQMLEEELTGKELDYLRGYYVDCLTHRQIGGRLGRSCSAVTRGIQRAEKKFDRIMERGALLWGADAL